MLTVAVAAACMTLCAQVKEQDVAPPPTLDDQYHTAWTIRDGVPPGLKQAKQTPDGFLWLASEAGLYRFDGVEFAKYQPPAGQKLLKEGPVTAVMVAPDGSLWIAYRYGGATHIQGRTITNYPAAGDLSESVFILVQDRDGIVWAATATGLIRFDGKQWKRVDESWGARIEEVDHLKLDPNGTLWVDNGKIYYLLPRGQKLFQATDIPAGKPDIFGQDAGWLTVDDDGLHPLHRSAAGTWSVGPRVFKENVSSITHAADGSIWLGAHDGIWRLRKSPDEEIKPEDFQTLRKTDGLTDDFVYAVAADREGSVWAITPNGLDQFRRTAFTTLPLPAGMQHLIMVSDGESVLVGSAFHTKTMLMRISARGSEEIQTNLVGIHAIYRAPNGVVWINADGKMWRLIGKTLTPLAGPKDFPYAKLKIRSMTVDKSGTLWAATTTEGPDKVYRLVGNEWTVYDGLKSLPRVAITNMITDSQGRVWMGTSRSLVAIVDPKGVQTFSKKEGLDSGPVTAMMESRSHDVWVGGTDNLVLFSNGKPHRVTSETGAAIAGVTGMVERSNGDTWLTSANGIVRIEASVLHDAVSSGSYRVRMQTLSYLDGYPAAPIVRQQSATAVETTDGRLYFQAREALVWIDPKQTKPNMIPPGVFVTSVIVDRHTYEEVGSLNLPKGAQNLQINYTATSLLVPSRVNFRYKLEGFDKDWQDAGTRRQAFYTGLPPGRYKFLVTACNNDGVWNTTGAALSLLLPPTFLQSIWFKLLCGVAVAMVLSALYLARVKMLTTEIQHRLFERLSERERIARDLHDTFFQNIQGLFLRFNTGTSLLKTDEPARRIFMDALEQSDQVMAEGRELVLELRADDTVVADLAQDLVRMGEHSKGEGKPIYKVISFGQVRKLHPVCATELLRIGREAIYNAFRHANAETIEAEVLYEKDFLKLRIRDDGQGMDEQVIRDGRRPGHMGLLGMSERAQSIGAHYSIWSRSGQGTEIDIEVPASIAYAPIREISPGWFSQRFRAIGWRN